MLEIKVNKTYYQMCKASVFTVFKELYDKSGNLVTGNPIKSSNEVSIVYSSSKKELQVYTTSGSNLEFYEFNY